MRKAVAHLKKADPVMARIIRQVGPYRIEYSPPDYSTIARCIVYQQLSGKAAARIYRRLEAALPGRRVTPEAVLETNDEKLRELGLSRQKIAYLKDFARAVAAGEIDLDALRRAPDEEVMRALTSRKGIGPWTVHMYLIFALRRPDVLPVGDLGIRVAVQRAYGFDELPAPAEVERVGRPWRPYASAASWYLWRSLGDGAGLDPVVD